MSEYPVGTVAMATVRGVGEVRVVHIAAHPGERDVVWYSADDVDGHWHVDQIEDIRPLVVLDPEDSDVKEFITNHTQGQGVWCVEGGAKVAAQIAAQIKPRIPEPTKTGSKVRAGYFGEPARELIRVAPGLIKNPDSWCWLDTSNGNLVTWRDLTDPVLVREGSES